MLKGGCQCSERVTCSFCLSAISEMGCVLFRSAFPGFKGPDLGRDPTAAEEQTFEADPGPGQHCAAFSQKKQRKFNLSQIIQIIQIINLSQRYSKIFKVHTVCSSF